MRELFLQKLPARVRMVLVSSDPTTTLDTLAETADRMLKVCGPPIATVRTTPLSPSPEVDALGSEVRQLQELVKTLPVRPRSPQYYSPTRLNPAHLDIAHPPRLAPGHLDIAHPPRLAPAHPAPLVHRHRTRTPLSAGTTNVLVARPPNVAHLAASRETTRPVASGDRRPWPGTKSPLLHYRSHSGSPLPCGYWRRG